MRWLFAILILSSACSPTVPERYRDELAGADPAEGKRLVFKFGCAVCHKISEVSDHPGTVAMPLKNWMERKYIAGRLPNRPESLVKWLMDPQKYEPDSGMPNLGITEEQARDMAAFLYGQ